MKFKKFTSWTGNRVSKDKRQSAKGENITSTQEKKSSSSGCSPTNIRNKSEECVEKSFERVGMSATKEERKSNKVDVAKPTRTQKGLLSNMGEDRPCFLFDDNEDDNANERDYGNNKNNMKANSDFNEPQISKLMIASPMTPKAAIDVPHISSPKNLFHPPQEIMVDHLAVPPSPMREPNVNVITSPSMGKNLLDDYRPSMFLNFQDSSPLETEPHGHCIGDPVGDIAMQRQLMDAQRLVRIILGKTVHKSQQILGASSILQAIRSYALMKAELIDLRQKQEIADGDPPAILQTIGSPAVTTPSTTRTGMCGARTPGLETGIKINDSICESIVDEIGHSSANLNTPIASDLKQANETIRRLQEELTIANRTLLELKSAMGFQNSTTMTHVKLEQSEYLTQNHHQPDEYILQEPELSKNLEARRQSEEGAKLYCSDAQKQLSEIEGSQQSMKNDDQSEQEESKQDGGLDLLLNEIILIPQHVLTKDIVREKLELYCHNAAQNSSNSQILEMEEKMRRSREESERRIREIETKLKLQEQEHMQQMQEMISDKEQTACAKRDLIQNTILVELSHNTAGNTGIDLSSPVKK